jgi:hypothetical protein
VDILHLGVLRFFVRLIAVYLFGFF